MRDYDDLNDYEIIYMVKENDEDAKQILFDKYKPLISKLASKYYGVGKAYGLEKEEFIQEGYFALFSAMKNYTDDKNCLFYTYAMISIKSKMINLIKRNKTNKQMALNNSLSLDRTLDDSENPLLDFVEDKKAIKPYEEIEVIELNDALKKILYELTIEEASAFELKINGFIISDICSLLDLNYNKVVTIIRNVRKKVSFIIEKTYY